MHRHSLRAATALFVIAALLFSRVALAAFACPGEMVQVSAVATEDCGDAMPQLPNLCEKSCHDDPQKFEGAQAPVIPYAAVNGLRIPGPIPSAPTAFSGTIEARAAAPPLILLFGRIRQ